MTNLVSDWCSTIEEGKVMARESIANNAGYCENTSHRIELVSNDGHRIIRAVRQTGKCGNYFLNEGWILVYGKLNVVANKDLMGDGYDLRWQVTRVTRIDNYPVPKGAYLKKDVLVQINEINDIKGNIFSEAIGKF